MMKSILWVIALGLVTACSAGETKSQSETIFHSNEVYKANGYPFSEAVETGGLVFLSGSIGTVPGTVGVVQGGIEAESRQTMDNIKASLEKIGLTMDDVVKCTVMIDNMADWPAFNKVYATYFDGDFPARSAFGADGLALGALIEVECIARR